MTCSLGLLDKHYMSKIATKFTADVMVKVGRQGFTLKIPIDLADLHNLREDPQGSVLAMAHHRIKNNLKTTVVNLAALKKAFKAYNKAHS